LNRVENIYFGLYFFPSKTYDRRIQAYKQINAVIRWLGENKRAQGVKNSPP